MMTKTKGMGLITFVWMLFIVCDLAESGTLQLSGMTQKEFEELSQEVGLAVSYLPLSPAEPLGLLGFDAGVETTWVNIREKRSFWQKAIHNPPSGLLIPKIHIQKGLPFGIDVGAVYSKIQQLDTTMLGGEIKWAVLPGNALLPAVALRGSYTRLSHEGDAQIDTFGADLTASKGFTFITPYAGFGSLWVRSRPQGGSSLKASEDQQWKAYAGVKITFVVVNLVTEIHYADPFPLYTTRLNVAF